MNNVPTPPPFHVSFYPINEENKRGARLVVRHEGEDLIDEFNRPIEIEVLNTSGENSMALATVIQFLMDLDKKARVAELEKKLADPNTPEDYALDLMQRITQMILTHTGGMN